MSLLSQDAMDEAINAADKRVGMHIEAARTAYWGQKRNRTPEGLRRLTDPKDRDTWMRFIARGKMQEEGGAVPSDLMTTVASHPAVQDGVTQMYGGDSDA